MLVEFYAIGLRFKADIIVTEGEDAIVDGPADNWYAGAAPDIDEWLELTCDGNDAMFLLDSMDMRIYEALYNAALEAAFTA